MNSLGCHAVVADVLGDVVVNAGRQRQVKEAVGLAAAGQRQQVLVQLGERGLLVILATHVRIPLEERLHALCFRLLHLVRVLVYIR